jgi:hypothetical protein
MTVQVDPMIVCTRILGGLGNQMFQYAAGLSLAAHLDARLTLDLSAFDHYSLRGYALSAFKIDAGSLQDRHKRSRPALEVWQESLSRRLGINVGPAKWHGVRKVIEPTTHFWSGFYDLNEDSYLEGYWQSPLYFRGVEQKLREAFSLSRFSNAATQEHEKMILREPQSVSVHVRRGDYVTDPRNMKIHGLCERPYYDRARRLLEKQVGATRFFVFSDNEAAARQEFADWSNTTFVSSNTQEEDMMLMSACHHSIIANSSFSWWAAWLNGNPNKYVVAPRMWFAREKMRTTSTIDIFPEEWILL